MELSPVSSSTLRVQPHVHGVESKLRGRFWMEGSASKTESGGDELDQLSCSLHKMSISSPTAPTSIESRATPHRPAMVVENSLRAECKCVIHSDSKLAVSSKCSSTASSKPRPWEGSLLQPRVSPKFMLCDAIEKAVVFCSSSPAAVGAASWRAGQAKSKEGVMVHARFNISGELERESRKGIQIQNLKCFSLGPSKARWFPSGSHTQWAFTVMCHISLFRAWWPCLPGQRLRSLETLEHHIRFLALPPISRTRSSSSRQWIVVGSMGLVPRCPKFQAVRLPGVP
jgi:hypothetical protein